MVDTGATTKYGEFSVGVDEYVMPVPILVKTNVCPIEGVAVKPAATTKLIEGDPAAITPKFDATEVDGNVTPVE